jgi:hypothetical protein
MNPKNRFYGDGRFKRKPGEPVFAGDEGMDMVNRLDEILADIMDKFASPRYWRADTGVLHELKAEEAEVVVQSDGEHIYIGRKIIDDPEKLAVLETGIYKARTAALEWAVKVKILPAEYEDDESSQRIRQHFGNKLGLDRPQSAVEYMLAFSEAGIDEDELEQRLIDAADEMKADPMKYAPEPERATEYLAACVELIRQVIENHRFTKETFNIVYRPLERLANQLTLFPPEFTEEDRDKLKHYDNMSDEEIDATLKGAQQVHQFFCQTLNYYKAVAKAVLETD